MEGRPGGRDRPGQVRKDLKNHCKSWGFIWKAMEVEKGFGALSRNSQICTLGSPLWLHSVGAGGGRGWKERDQRGTGRGLGGGDCKGDRHWRPAAGRADKGVRARGRKKDLWARGRAEWGSPASATGPTLRIRDPQAGGGGFTTGRGAKPPLLPRGHQRGTSGMGRKLEHSAGPASRQPCPLFLSGPV